MLEQNAYGQLEMLGKTCSAEKSAFGFAFLYKRQRHSLCYIGIHQMKTNEGKRCKKKIRTLLARTHESNLLEDLL